MKLCFVSPGSYALFHPSARYTFGGAEVQMYLLASELAKDKSMEVSFIVGDFGQPVEELVQGIRLIRGMKYEKRTFWNFIMPMNKISHYSAMKRADADIYIVRTASAIVGLTCLFARMLGKKFVFMTASEIDCDGRFERSSGPIVGAIYRYGLMNADLVITQSEEHRKLLSRIYKLTAYPLKSGYPIKKAKSTRKHVLWVARCDRSKRPDIIIELAKRFREVKFLFICPPGEDLEYYCQITSGFPDNIEHKSFVPFRDISDYFAKALVFVNTSEFEGFPNTFIQACLAGTPILSYKVNPDSVLDKEGIGIACKGDRLRLEKELQKLLRNKQFRERLGRKALKYAKNNHDIRQVAASLKRLLEKLEAD